MGSKVSQPVRILALVGVLGALALGAGFTMLGKSSGSSAPPAVIKPLHPKHKGATAHAAPAHATHRAKSAAKAQVAAHAKAAVVVHHKAKAATAKRKAAVAVQQLPDNGLPSSVNAALALHEVVVVSLYDPAALVDAASVGEAQVGARLANAGFVPLNVMSEAQAVPLAKKLGVLPDPALLIFRRPGDLVFRVNGFADRATVAQAASNARP
jgi:hypothetical protein